MQGVEAGRELRLQRRVDSPMTGQPGEARERRRPDLHGIMCLAAGRCAGMPMVKMGLVNYIKLGGGKSSFQSSPHALCAACQFLRH